ncbi:hypothetical protein OUZ56_017284 [Daphnia magna]|uniref:Uncharacterized protein n=1 Tax=Daphnia magna TaxID=35525 RepID=A0ABR0ASN6_9CRUS|nr:hypothetical protein OUZ56_017284 [Daphnia magna]
MSGGTGFDDLRLQGQQLLTTDLMTLRPEIIQLRVRKCASNLSDLMWRFRSTGACRIRPPTRSCPASSRKELKVRNFDFRDFFRKCQLLSTFNADCEGRFFDRQFSHGWLATYRLSSGVCREPPAPSDNPLDPQQTRIPSYAVINWVVFVLRFEREDSNYVYVTLLRLCDLVPNIPLRRIECQERWTFMEFHQLVDVLWVDASTTQDLANPIVNECFKSASAGRDPTHDEGYVDRLVLEDEAEIRHSSISFCACIREYTQVLLRPTSTLMSETSWHHQQPKIFQVLVPVVET